MYLRQDPHNHAVPRGAQAFAWRCHRMSPRAFARAPCPPLASGRREHTRMAKGCAGGCVSDRAASVGDPAGLGATRGVPLRMWEGPWCPSMGLRTYLPGPGPPPPPPALLRSQARNVHFLLRCAHLCGCTHANDTVRLYASGESAPVPHVRSGPAVLAPVTET
jgi:hypothetical protein